MGEPRDDAKALCVSLKATVITYMLLHGAVQRFLCDVAERRMAKIVGKAAGSNCIRVQREDHLLSCARDVTCLGDLAQPLGVPPAHLCNLHRMGQAIVESVPVLRGGHLSHVGQALKRRAVQNSIAVPLAGAAIILLPGAPRLGALTIPLRVLPGVGQTLA